MKIKKYINKTPGIEQCNHLWSVSGIGIDRIDWYKYTELVCEKCGLTVKKKTAMRYRDPEGGYD